MFKVKVRGNHNPLIHKIYIIMENVIIMVEINFLIIFEIKINLLIKEGYLWKYSYIILQ